MSAVEDRLRAALADRYRIERELGAGGMATVYLARDLKHERDVAIKVLHPDLAAALGAERFLTEIRTTANLQHPHILPLHDSGEADGFLFYVMPFVDGPTLRTRLTRDRQLPIPEALRIAREVADALSYAHGRGVIHRDIKPENILLQGGHALVADFGIALAVQTAGGQRMTQTGLSLGTPQYMSPEQAMGERAIDARADVYALGAVTYEMLTGDPPFTGSSVQAIVAKVLTDRPAPIRTTRDTVSHGMEAAVMTALAKLPADRFESAARFAEALGARGDTAARAAAASGALAPRGGLRSRAAQLAIAGNVLLLGAVAALATTRSNDPPTTRQQVVLWRTGLQNAQVPGASYIGSQAAISPDGRTVVFADSSDDGWHLKRKRQESALPDVMEGTRGGISPTFSADGKWVAFVTLDGKLKKVATDGGTPIVLTDDVAGDYRVPVWLDDGTIVYVSTNFRMVRFDPSGRAPLQVLKLPGESGNTAITSIAGLPGSKAFLFVLCPGNCAFASDAYVYDFSTDSARLVVRRAASVAYSPTGHLLYTSRDGGLFAAGFDPRRRAVTSDPVPVIDGVAPGSFALSPAGVAVYALASDAAESAQLVWVDRAGNAQPFDSTWQGRFEYPALSPDGRTVAVSVRDKSVDLWLRRADGTRRKINAPGVANWRPAWFAGGSALTFISVSNQERYVNEASVYRVSVASDGVPELLVRYRDGTYEAEVSPDTQWVALRIDDERAGGNIYARRLHGDTTLVPLVVNPSNDIQINLSPDGRRIAYTVTEGGVQQVYAATFPGMQSRLLVSRGGGRSPRWSRSGREMFFESGGKMMAAPIGGDDGMTVGEPRALFSMQGYRSARNRPQYDVAPGDQRFLMIKEAPPSAVPPVVYVEHWFGELTSKLRR
jgi:eukaryotic-like serine/threonine-protein kinase